MIILRSLSNSNPRYYTTREGHKCAPKNIHKNIHGAINQNSQNPDTTQMSGEQISKFSLGGYTLLMFIK